MAVAIKTNQAPAFPIRRKRAFMTSAFCRWNLRTGIFIGALLEMLLSLAFIGMTFGLALNTSWSMIKLDSIGTTPLSLTVCLAWIILDRILVLIASSCLLLGEIQQIRTLFLPYLFWSALNKVPNASLCVYFVAALMYPIYLWWAFICLEAYVALVAVSRYLTLPSEIELYQSYLDRMRLHGLSSDNGGYRKTPSSSTSN